MSVSDKGDDIMSSKNFESCPTCFFKIFSFGVQFYEFLIKQGDETDL